MARYRFGDGRYRYFDHPLPDADRRAAQRVLPAPRADRERLVGACSAATRTRSRSSTSELLERCRAAGQERPTPLILRYGAGDWNALHQDLYGDVFFPFQVLTVLSEPGVDYEGGEFVLLEQRPRAQSRAHVVTAPRGAFVVFPTHQRPQQGARGYYQRRPAPRREHRHARLADGARHHLPRREVGSRAARRISRSRRPARLTGMSTRQREHTTGAVPARAGGPAPAAWERMRRDLAGAAERSGLIDVAFERHDSPLGTILVGATREGLVRVGLPAEDEDAVLQQLAERVSARRAARLARAR